MKNEKRSPSFEKKVMAVYCMALYRCRGCKSRKAEYWTLLILDDCWRMARRNKCSSWVTQEDIAFGAHEQFVANSENKATVLRRVREAVRRLRIEMGVPIISSLQGYRLPLNAKEALEFLSKMRRTAAARAAASFRTYRAMKHATDETIALFNS